MLDFEKIKVYGRSVDDGGITVDWTASGIEFNALCQGDVYVLIKHNSAQEIYFSAYVDRVKTRVCANEFKKAEGEYLLPLAKNLSSGVHNFKLLRQSEAERGPSTVADILLDGQFLARPESSNTLIEFIGDSITCGYANLATCSMPPDPCSTSLYEEGTLGYAYLTAEKLGFDFSMLSRQGTGIVAGWDYLTNPMGAIPRVYHLNSFYRDQREYDFKRKADIVVINLGTNDIYKYLGDEKDENLSDSDFIDIIYSVLCDVNDKNGDPIMIVAVGMMTNPQTHAPLYEWYNKAIERFEDSRGRKIHFCHLPENYKGGKAHPDVEGHRAAAEVLTKFIENLL